ncbi:MAG: hypothetical protein VB128_09690 [Sedimentibacter saalensis]|nr:hypothetical protein [Sedimentibacter saalensis]MEA5095214.1 hypothetical protein [Sedimentibacter saalensis]
MTVLQQSQTPERCTLLNLYPPKGKWLLLAKSPKRSALSAAVNWRVRPKVHLPLTCMVFDPMVHPVFEVTKHILGLPFKGEDLRKKNAKSGFIFNEWANDLMSAFKTRHSGTQWLTLPYNNISKLAIGIKHL